MAVRGFREEVHSANIADSSHPNTIGRGARYPPPDGGGKAIAAPASAPDTRTTESRDRAPQRLTRGQHKHAQEGKDQE